MKENAVIWNPSDQASADSEMARFVAWLDSKGVGRFGSYEDLHRWSVTDIEGFWGGFLEWSGCILGSPQDKVIDALSMPGAKWFPGATLNFSRNLLRYADGKNEKKVCLVSVSESRPRMEWTYGELARSVSSLAAFLKARGVRRGDRVAAVASNTPEPVAGLLAAAGFGAIWSSCSPDFGVQGILDRFGQIEPLVLFAVDGYVYNGKRFDLTARVREIASRIPSVGTIVWIPQIGTAEKLGDREFLWTEAACSHAPGKPSFDLLPFDHPVYILYSSGTTGVPKCIVHGAGGALLQHLKELRLHGNIREGDTFFYFTTCGWMMWNWLVSGLAVGAKLVLFDGSPSHPSMDRLWEMAEAEGVDHFGTSAKFISSCRSAGIDPGSKFGLKRVRTVFSTGSPLMPEDFDWVYAAVSKDVMLASISGGTDIVSCFVLGNPMLAVRRGEIQCKGLGMAVEAFSDDGSVVVGEQGELVCTKPAPSMPVGFWNDPGGEKYRSAYFDHFPGVWRHGDFVIFTPQGGCVMLGRSDATLNPSGVRIGTSEIYRQVETMPEIADSLAVGFPVDGDEKIVLFVVPGLGVVLDAALEKRIRDRIREGTTPRHVPWKILAIREVPYTINGKKVELAVAAVLRGEEVKNRDVLSNPACLEQFSGLDLR